MAKFLICTSSRLPIAFYRWAPAFQNDWAARADWCVKPPKEANHPPVVKLNHSQDLKAKPGQTVSLAADATDPDGDKIAYLWWQYREPGTYPSAVKLSNANKTTASFVAPENANPGQTVHIICEAISFIVGADSH